MGLAVVATMGSRLLGGTSGAQAEIFHVVWPFSRVVSGVEMAPGTMQSCQEAGSRDESQDSLFSLVAFYFCFRFGSRWFVLGKLSRGKGVWLQRREVAVSGASQTRLSLGRARRLVYIIARWHG